ncbi:MAG: hypothetical protein IPK99_14565 [Flavobacteriales bacterium]|nr:hypothetical protein [Flavobacteriales bacterium]
MKHFRIACFAATALLFQGLEAQHTMAEMLTNKTKLTWIGVDYTEVRLSPKEKFREVDEHTLEYYRVWNKLFETEKAKYDLCPFMQVSDCALMTAAVQNVNAQADITRIWDAPEFDKERIPDMVRAYQCGDRDGVGCVYIATRYDAAAETAEYMITFFDMTTRDVLHVEKATTKPGGASMRNYWSSSALRVHELIKSDLRKSWVKQYVK